MAKITRALGNKHPVPRFETAKRRSRRRPPWGEILGNPIVRLAASTRESQEIRDFDDKYRLRQQYEKMLKVLEFFGIPDEPGPRPWYELALRLASKFDDGLKIVDAPRERRGKTAPRWKGTIGFWLLADVEHALTLSGAQKIIARLKWLQQVAPDRNGYGKMSLEQLEARYYEAKKYHTDRGWTRAEAQAFLARTGTAPVGRTKAPAT